MEKIKVIIVDDNLLIRNGLIVELKKNLDVEVIGIATNGEEFLDLLPGKKPDLIFMDVNMPVLDGYKATERAIDINPTLKIIAVSTSCDEISLKRMVKAGARGYILKNISFKHNNQEFNFTEKVKAISLLDFKNYFLEAGVELKHCFGDYQLNVFNKETSSRLILIFN